jgi:hypothetical protein
MNGVIRGMHHAGLPSHKGRWPEVRAFWEGLGLECRLRPVPDPHHDHAGAGARLQVYAGQDLLISYFDVGKKVVDPHMRVFHLALSIDPRALDMVRQHKRFVHETHWGRSFTSVFLRGPFSLRLELIAEDTAFHREG